MALLARRRPEPLAAMRDAAARIREVWATLAVANVWADTDYESTAPDLERELKELVWEIDAAHASSPHVRSHEGAGDER